MPSKIPPGANIFKISNSIIKIRHVGDVDFYRLTKGTTL